MTLLITVFAAVIATIVWYVSANARSLKCGILCYLYWGASLMWMVDAVAEYIQLRAEYFHPELYDMVNDAFLGFAVVAFGLVIWMIVLLISDPKQVVRDTLLKGKK